MKSSSLLNIIFVVIIATSCRSRNWVNTSDHIDYATDTLGARAEESDIMVDVTEVGISRRQISVRLVVKNRTSSVIMKPVTAKVFYYDYTPEPGILSTRAGTYPLGLTLKDNFGNSFELSTISPELHHRYRRNIRPDQDLRFQATFKGAPLPNTEFLILDIGFLSEYIPPRKIRNSSRSKVARSIKIPFDLLTPRTPKDVP